MHLSDATPRSAPARLRWQSERVRSSCCSITINYADSSVILIKIPRVQRASSTNATFQDRLSIREMGFFPSVCRLALSHLFVCYFFPRSLLGTAENCCVYSPKHTLESRRSSAARTVSPSHYTTTYRETTISTQQILAQELFSMLRFSHRELPLLCIWIRGSEASDSRKIKYVLVEKETQ